MKYAIVILLGVLAAPTGGAADPLFQDDSTLKVEITAPLSSLVRERSETDYLQGTFSFTGADGSPVDLDVQLRARGNFRYRNCDFPPVTLNFKRSQVEGTLFEHQNKLKLVSHCKITRRYERAVLREFLAYRLLNELTDSSYRVRLLQVTWVDNEERMARMARNAFLIEHRNRLGARLGKDELELARAEVDALQPDQLNITSMYQYLIGNVDFSPVAGSNNECCHNYTLFGNGSDPIVAIPYDFDLAGIVSAPYQQTDEERGVEHLGQRVYRGYCANNDHVGHSMALFQEARDRLFARVDELEELEPGIREVFADYMEEFYEVISDPKMVEKKILDACR